MANYTISPYLLMNVPSLTDPGPDYSTNISNALLYQVDPHDHSGAPGHGKQINIAGQLISNDLQLDGYNLGTIRSTEFVNQTSPLTGSQDVNALYVLNNVLGFNNSNGIFVPLTGISPSAFTGLSLYLMTANHTIQPTDTYNAIDVQISAAALLTLPLAAAISPTPAGRFFYITDIGNTFATDNLTITASGADTISYLGATSSSVVFNNNGQSAFIYTDGVSKWFLLPFAKNHYSATETITVLGNLSVPGIVTIPSGGALTTNTGSATTVAGPITISGTATITGNILNNFSANIFNESTNSYTSASITMDAGSTFTNAGITDLNGTTNINSTAHLLAPLLITGAGTITSEVASGITTNTAGGIATSGSGTIVGAINATTSLTSSTSTTLSSSIVEITGQIQGTAANPFNLGHFNVSLVGGIANLASSLNNPMIYTTAANLSSILYLNFGGQSPGAIFFIDTSQTAVGIYSIVVYNYVGGTQVTLPIASGKQSFFVTFPSTTTISVG